MSDDPVAMASKPYLGFRLPEFFDALGRSLGAGDVRDWVKLTKI